MRKAILGIFILAGSIAGVLATIGQTVGVKIVLGSVGAVAGAAIGGALARGGRRGSSREDCDDGMWGLTRAQDEQVRNYWLDRGRLTASPGLPHPEDTEPHIRDA